jgi:hypothetical protein
MEIISGLNQKKRFSFDMEVYPYLRDHCFEGTVILSAVESMIALARAVGNFYPGMNLNCMKNARFPRFLPLATDIECRKVLVDVEKSGDGGIIVSLLTSVKSKTGKISREVEHARVEFVENALARLSDTPFRAVTKLEGDCISIPSAAVYRDLVPFGNAYQNIIGDLAVSSHGALAYVSGGKHEADEELLGSPFPLDAAMHAACVWGQRFAGIVCFPVGFEKRVIYLKTKKRKEYLARVAPVRVTGESLVFDLWIYDLNDIIFEGVSGLIMKDVSKGRIRPPEWIRVNS